MFFSRTKRRRSTQQTIVALLLFLSFVFWHRIRHAFDQVAYGGNRGAGFAPHPAFGGWNLFYHLGGNGPWIPKIDGVVGDVEMLPEGCVVDQVHMLSRHAERYPTRNAGARHLELLSRLRHAELSTRGSLSFLSEWTYFTNISEPEFEDLTSTGPYAGTLQAHNTGRKLRERYDSLIDGTRSTNFWTCSSPRDIETAEHFASGFFGPLWATDGSARLHVIPETAERGADTLTPGVTCLQYIKDKEHGHDQGYSRLAEWQNKFSKPVIHRLKLEAPQVIFTPLDVYSMMEMCGFEILARGTSPWCDVFTPEEWLDFEYARDLLHFYRAGPGNKYAGAMGWLWLNATQELLADPDAIGVYFSFAHDGDIVPLMATLELFSEKKGEISSTADFWNTKEHLPVDRIKADRAWRTSDIVPMGGRVIFERVNCRSAPFVTPANQTFTKLYINDGLIPPRDGFAGDVVEHGTRLGRFRAMVRAKGVKFGDFRTVCGLGDGAASRITFLHQ